MGLAIPGRYVHPIRLTEKTALFKPPARYDIDGDCIEFNACPDLDRLPRLDDLVTVYYSQVAGYIVGTLLEGARLFIKNTEGFSEI